MYVCIYACIYIKLSLKPTGEGFEHTTIEFRSSSNQLRYQVISSTCTQNQVCTALAILLFIQC